MRNQQPLLKVPETIKNTITFSCISENLEISTSSTKLKKIWELRTREYLKQYSEFSCNDGDSYDSDALVLYSKNKQGKLVSTGRIVFDSSQGLPADAFVKYEVDKLRAQGLNIAELSKLAVSEEATGMLSEYIESFYRVSIQQNVDSLIFICKHSSAVIYKRLVGARMLVKDIHYTYGTNFTFSLLEWRIKESKYHQKRKSMEVVA